MQRNESATKTCNFAQLLCFVDVHESCVLVAVATPGAKGGSSAFSAILLSECFVWS